eukprot:TRINITY_DN1168_c0_g1_i9.p1 TRINITY_DN1168_c0_g1~~TRINITY_DN1168_c0_g1_i9.p1  ORF type:complete len:661 (-),score=200.92 TRINITY_DN1168_c0_g1_i9:221-2203(-)
MSDDFVLEFDQNKMNDDIHSEYHGSKIDLTNHRDEESIEMGDKKPQKGMSVNHENSFKYLSNVQNKQFDITLKNVGLTVERKSCNKVEKTRILHSVTADFKRGKMVAIMGSSGSGKTTLLNILGQKMGGIMTGEVLANGRKFGKKEFKHNMAYVQQDDLLLAFLTVQETLGYAAKLRLTKDMSDEQKLGIVDEVIKELNLTSCQNTYIGGEGKKGISGGQRKRVSIGQELLNNPSVILLDEPTSGLDSATSINLIHSLKDFAKQGRTIISTIHQPSAEVFFLFDKILLLANGHQVYYGSTKKVVPYFANLGYQCPQYQNPADYVLNLITAGYKLQLENKTIESAEITKDLIEKYKHKEKKAKNYGNQGNEEEKKKNKSSQLYKFGVLLERSTKQIMRDPASTFAKIFQNIFFGVLVGLIYLKLNHFQEGITNRIGVLFFVVINMIMPNLIGELFTFPSERGLFMREKGGGWYGLLAYYFSKMLAMMPMQIIGPMIFSIIIYWMVGLQKDAGKFFIFYITLVLLTHNAVALAVAISTATKSFQISLIFAPIIFIPLMLLGGFFVKSSSIPVYLIWVKFVSPFKYGYEILFINEFSGLKLTCKLSELVSGVCPITSGSVAIKTNLEGGASIWRGFVILSAITVFLHLFAITIRYLSSRKQKA